MLSLLAAVLLLVFLFAHGGGGGGDDDECDDCYRNKNAWGPLLVLCTGRVVVASSVRLALWRSVPGSSCRSYEGL